MRGSGFGTRVLYDEPLLSKPRFGGWTDRVGYKNGREW